MYQNYYTSSDVHVYLSSLDHTRIIKLDTTVGIGYSLSQSSIPIYSLGYRKPQFFSQGNTLGQGSLTIAFTDEEALKYAISYITTGEEEATAYFSKKLGKKTNNVDFIAASNASAFNVTGDKKLISIGAIQPIFNIKLFINNETVVRGSDTKVISLTGVKIVNENLQVSSQQDSTLLLNYTFYFKDIERG